MQDIRGGGGARVRKNNTNKNTNSTLNEYVCVWVTHTNERGLAVRAHAVWVGTHKHRKKWGTDRKKWVRRVSQADDTQKQVK